MSDYRAIVENIRSFLASDYQIRSDEVVAWAEGYARLCREANDRLQQCADYLKKRLRAEAIHCAEESPNLLDLVAALDFPELPDWRQASFRFDLPDPPVLMIDTAATLNEAYSQEQPVEGLMAQHRLLALARAPLKVRLGVMRRIDEQDSTASVFAEDIRLFEGMRLEEIRSSVATLARQHNLNAVRQVQSELKENWRMEVPRDLRAVVDNLALRFQQSSAETEIRALMPSLSSAYSAMSEEEARTILGQIIAIATQAQLRLPAELQDQIDPISTWMHEAQSQREQAAALQEACDALQQAIDTEASAPKLERAYREALRFKRDLPVQLEAGYQRAIEQRAAAVRHKRLLIVGAIAGSFLLIAGIAGVIILQVLKSNEIQDVTSLIDQAHSQVDGGDLTRARQVVKQVLAQHSRIAGAPAVVRAASDFQAAADAEEHRQEELAKQTNLILASGIQSPDMKALESAAQIAKTPDEQRAVSDLRAKIAEYAQEQQSKIDGQFTEDAAELGKQINTELGASSAVTPAIALQKIDVFLQGVGKLRERTTVSAGLRQAQSASLLAILTQKRSAAQEAAGLADLLHRVERVKTIEDQSAALKAVLSKTNDPQITSDFQKALDLTTPEQAIDGWGKLSVAWQSPPTTYADASARAEQIQKYLDAYAEGPLTQPVTEYLAYLKLGLEVAAPNGPWKKSFHDLLANPLIHDLHQVTTSEGKRYYTMGKPTIVPHSANGQLVSEEFKAITSSDVTQQHVIALHAPVSLKVEDAASPQSLYADATLRKLAAFDFIGWESIGSRCENDLLSEKEIDPILRGILIHNLLSLNQSVAAFGGDASSKKVLDGLSEKNVDDVEWLNPDNPPRATVVSDVSGLLSQLPTTDKFDAEVKSHRDKVMAALPMGLTPVGVLLKSQGRASILIDDERPMTAYAVGVSKRLVVVGHRGPKGWTTSPAAVADVPAGSLLFVSMSAK